jgi:2-polyprenyl-3-methyl-5-hydroxy-6-metoxy-1,4-benzoquinol methylase
MTATMHALQESAHGLDHDYVTGSPHLQHARLNGWMRDTLNGVVAALADRSAARPRVLEVGAGHGPFTETLLAAGAEVVVTEMSAPSAEHLRARFRHNPLVQVVHDRDGDLTGPPDVDLVVFMSVLHHIPDYLAALRAAADRVRPGGALVSFQDPLRYSTQSRRSRAVAKAATLAWRVGQGDVTRGVRTQVRRLRGVYDTSNPSDMSEYHCVRDGVDSAAVAALLAERFGTVSLHPYWSTQATWAQSLGARLAPANTFGVVALDRRPSTRG